MADEEIKIVVAEPKEDGKDEGTEEKAEAKQATTVVVDPVEVNQRLEIACCQLLSPSTLLQAEAKVKAEFQSKYGMKKKPPTFAQKKLAMVGILASPLLCSMWHAVSTCAECQPLPAPTSPGRPAVL